MPYAGGACTIFHAWPSKLARDIEVLALQLPGRQDRLGEVPLSRMAELASRVDEAIAALPSIPTALYGHSFGACAAFEVARRLQARCAAPIALVVGGAQAPHLPRAGTPIAALPAHHFLDALHERFKTPRELLDNDELMSLALPALRADIESLETYAHVSTPRLLVPITVLHGSEDEFVSRESAEAWADVTTGAVAVHTIDAGHLFVDTHSDWVTLHVARTLAQHIESR